MSFEPAIALSRSLDATPEPSEADGKERRCSAFLPGAGETACDMT
jgi:hypothetical protein